MADKLVRANNYVEAVARKTPFHGDYLGYARGLTLLVLGHHAAFMRRGARSAAINHPDAHGRQFGACSV